MTGEPIFKRLRCSSSSMSALTWCAVLCLIVQIFAEPAVDEINRVGTDVRIHPNTKDPEHQLTDHHFVTKKQLIDQLRLSGNSVGHGEDPHTDFLSEVLPEVDFECQNREAGFYADHKFECQVFHYCKMDGTKFTFACPPGTKFSKEKMLCDPNEECNAQQVTETTVSTTERTTAAPQNVRDIISSNQRIDNSSSSADLMMAEDNTSGRVFFTVAEPLAKSRRRRAVRRKVRQAKFRTPQLIGVGAPLIFQTGSLFDPMLASSSSSQAVRVLRQTGSSRDRGIPSNGVSFSPNFFVPALGSFPSQLQVSAATPDQSFIPLSHGLSPASTFATNEPFLTLGNEFAPRAQRPDSRRPGSHFSFGFSPDTELSGAASQRQRELPAANAELEQRARQNPREHQQLLQQQQQQHEFNPFFQQFFPPQQAPQFENRPSFLEAEPNQRFFIPGQQEGLFNQGQAGEGNQGGSRRPTQINSVDTRLRQPDLSGLLQTTTPNAIDPFFDPRFTPNFEQMFQQGQTPQTPSDFLGFSQPDRSRQPNRPESNTRRPEVLIGSNFPNSDDNIVFNDLQFPGPPIQRRPQSNQPEPSQSTPPRERPRQEKKPDAFGRPNSPLRPVAQRPQDQRINTPPSVFNDPFFPFGNQPQPPRGSPSGPSSLRTPVTNLPAHPPTRGPVSHSPRPPPLRNSEFSIDDVPLDNGFVSSERPDIPRPPPLRAPVASNQASRSRGRNKFGNDQLREEIGGDEHGSVEQPTRGFSDRPRGPNRPSSITEAPFTGSTSAELTGIAPVTEDFGFKVGSNIEKPQVPPTAPTRGQPPSRQTPPQQPTRFIPPPQSRFPPPQQSRIPPQQQRFPPPPFGSFRGQPFSQFLGPQTAPERRPPPQPSSAESVGSGEVSGQRPQQSNQGGFDPNLGIFGFNSHFANARPTQPHHHVIQGSPRDPTRHPQQPIPTSDGGRPFGAFGRPAPAPQLPLRPPPQVSRPQAQNNVPTASTPSDFNIGLFGGAPFSGGFGNFPLLQGNNHGSFVIPGDGFESRRPLQPAVPQTASPQTVPTPLAGSELVKQDDLPKQQLRTTEQTPLSTDASGDFTSTRSKPRIRGRQRRPLAARTTIAEPTIETETSTPAEALAKPLRPRGRLPAPNRPTAANFTRPRVRPRTRPAVPSTSTTPLPTPDLINDITTKPPRRARPFRKRKPGFRGARRNATTTATPTLPQGEESALDSTRVSPEGADDSIVGDRSPSSVAEIANRRKAAFAARAAAKQRTTGSGGVLLIKRRKTTTANPEEVEVKETKPPKLASSASSMSASFSTPAFRASSTTKKSFVFTRPTTTTNTPTPIPEKTEEQTKEATIATEPTSRGELRINKDGITVSNQKLSGSTAATGQEHEHISASPDNVTVRSKGTSRLPSSASTRRRDNEASATEGSPSTVTKSETTTSTSSSTTSEPKETVKDYSRTLEERSTLSDAKTSVSQSSTVTVSVSTSAPSTSVATTTTIAPAVTDQRIETSESRLANLFNRKFQMKRDPHREDEPLIDIDDF